MLENRLKDCREELEMTQTELGYVFGVSNTTVSGWENNNDIMPLTKLVKFSNLYGYSLDYLTGLNRSNNISNSKFSKLDKKCIGNGLKELRKKLNITQQQMADECMISQTTYSNYELGYYLITSLTLYTICKNHKISIDKFLKKCEKK